MLENSAKYYLFPGRIEDDKKQVLLEFAKGAEVDFRFPIVTITESDVKHFNLKTREFVAFGNTDKKFNTNYVYLGEPLEMIENYLLTQLGNRTMIYCEGSKILEFECENLGVFRTANMFIVNGGSNIYTFDTRNNDFSLYEDCTCISTSLAQNKGAFITKKKGIKIYDFDTQEAEYADSDSVIFGM